MKKEFIERSVCLYTEAGEGSESGLQSMKYHNVKRNERFPQDIIVYDSK